MNQAKLYSRANELQRCDAKMVLEEFGGLLKWKEGDSLLDIGSGSGDVTVELVLAKMPRDYKLVMGMDISERMVSYAREKYCSQHLDLKFVQGNIAGDLKQFSGFSFDHITSFFCLHWVQDQRRAFANIFHMLKPGGDCLISMLARMPIFEVYKRMAKQPKWAEYLQDVAECISPYQDASDPVALAGTYLKEFFYGSYEAHIRERLYVYDDVNTLKGK